jgi:hypothetical protein
MSVFTEPVTGFPHHNERTFEEATLAKLPPHQPKCRPDPQVPMPFAILGLRGFCATLYRSREQMEQWSTWMTKRHQPHVCFEYSEITGQYKAITAEPNAIPSEEPPCLHD